jgi:hypothetical protein
MPRPLITDYATYYAPYIALVQENDVLSAIAGQQEMLASFLKSVPENKWDYAYAPGKWSIKEILQHLIDGERIFTYRALRFARKDETSLPGFDENIYAPASEAGRRKPAELMEEMLTIRKATELLFKSFTPEMLERSGIASNQPVTVNALGFITIGHCYHHFAIVRERYL